MFKTLELPGGFAPLTPLPGLFPGPPGGPKRPPDPSPNNFAPPPPIPGYGPGNVYYKVSYMYFKQIYGMLRVNENIFFN